MVGDSHVCSRIYPNVVNSTISGEEADINFSYFGKIGAGFYTYNDTPQYMNEIYDASPEILIVHLGTNDSYTRNFSRKKFLGHLSIFYDNVEKRLPECKIVFVTPFYNRLRGSKTPNKNTRRCAEAIRDFTSNHRNTYLVDNNADHGMYFLNHRGEMMRNDCIHLTERGYEVLGRQVGEALVGMEDLWIIEEPPYMGDMK